MLQALSVHHSSQQQGIILQLPQGGYGRMTKGTAGGDALAERIIAHAAAAQQPINAIPKPNWVDKSGYCCVSLRIWDASNDVLVVRDPSYVKLLDGIFRRCAIVELGQTVLARVTKRTAHGTVLSLGSGGASVSGIAMSPSLAQDPSAAAVKKGAKGKPQQQQKPNDDEETLPDAIQIRVLWYDASSGVATCCSSSPIVNRAPNASSELLRANEDSALSETGVPQAFTSRSPGVITDVTVLAKCSGCDEVGSNETLYVCEMRHADDAVDVPEGESQPFASALVYVPVPKSTPLLSQGTTVRVQLRFVPTTPAQFAVLPFAVARWLPQSPVAETTPWAHVLSGKATAATPIAQPATGASEPVYAPFAWRLDPSRLSDKKRQREEDADDADDPKNRIRRRQVEEALDQYERRGEQAPTNPEEFDKLLLAAPNSSYTWTQYMAYYMNLQKVDQARNIAERALKKIDVTESKERLNVWVAYLNLENLHGTAESLAAIFRRALQNSDDELAVHERLADIFHGTRKLEQYMQLCKAMTSKFKENTRVWQRYGKALIEQDRRDQLKRVLKDMGRCVKNSEQSLVLVHLAIHEFRHGSVDHGRSLFESLVSKLPKKTDVWNAYLDQELALLSQGSSEGSVTATRTLFSRAATVPFPPKAMQGVLTRYLAFEQKHGSKAEVEKVKARAKAYVDARISASTGTAVE